MEDTNEMVMNAKEMLDSYTNAQKKTLKSGFLTTEFLTVIVTGILGVLKGTILPELPVESMYVSLMYILSRTILKAKVVT